MSREGGRASEERGRGKVRCEHTVCGCWRHRCGGCCRCGARRRDRRAWLRCRWAVAGPGQASRRRTEPENSDQAPLVWRAPEGSAAVPVGGGGAWPGFETTRRSAPQPHRCGGRRRVRRTWLRCPWAVAGPGQASRRRTEPENSDQAPLVWRAPEGPEGLAAVPVGGGGAWPGFEIDHSEPQARVWRSRGRAAAHGRIKQPGLTKHTRRPKHPWRPTTTMTRPTRCAARAGTVRGSG